MPLNMIVKYIIIFAEKWVGPNNGITSFDNIFLAMLTVFQVKSFKFIQILTVKNWVEYLNLYHYIYYYISTYILSLYLHWHVKSYHHFNKCIVTSLANASLTNNHIIIFQCVTMEGWTPILYWVSLRLTANS